MISFLAMLFGSWLLEETVRPRRGGRQKKQWQGVLIQLLLLTMSFGLFLAASGNSYVSAALTFALVALFTTCSNAKHAMLGEPLIFSDLALIAAVFRHPRFYLTAISIRQRWMLTIVAVLLLGALALLFVPHPKPHWMGLGLFVSAAAVLRVLLALRPFTALALTPDLNPDVGRYGLMATLMLYWIRWRATPNPPACGDAAGVGADDDAPDLILIVQCESFADPVDLTGDPAYALPGLERARKVAWQWGELSVSGFGAYTMRTEYGVLFGRSEAELGFRRYDPFLTAHGETSYALSARLSARGYHCLFVHPHDMRFYGRDRLMPAIGFDHLIGEDSFPPLPSDGGRYIGDRTVAASLGALVGEAAGPTLLYTVTMENHGPWDKDHLTGSPGGLGAYLRHLRNSDAMLSDLMDRLSGAGRSALLVFFGDHRPSIPGVTEPGGARHTPYVMLRFGPDGSILTGANLRADLSPDALHHAIMGCAQGKRSA